jgi:hypothetical protein
MVSGRPLISVPAFLKKWWVDSDFKAPTPPLSLLLKVSGFHYNSIWVIFQKNEDFSFSENNLNIK